MIEGSSADGDDELSDVALLAILHAHPDLRDRIASIALTVENLEGDLKEADAAEWRRCGCWGERRCRDGREASGSARGVARAALSLPMVAASAVTSLLKVPSTSTEPLLSRPFN
jgi:hypothetical protein